MPPGRGQNVMTHASTATVASIPGRLSSLLRAIKLSGTAAARPSSYLHRQAITTGLGLATGFEHELQVSQYFSWHCAALEPDHAVHLLP